jgi:hypothetical protein
MLCSALLHPHGAVGADAGQRLAELRSDFESAMVSSAVEPLKQLVKDLNTLEIKARDATDYETAIAARTARMRAESELTAAEKLMLLRQSAEAVVTVGRIELKLADAELEGVRWDAEKAVLTDWKSASSRATWTLPGIPAGGYEVVLRYRSGPDEGGTVKMAERFYTLTVPTRFTLNGAEDHFLGTLRVSDGSGPLVIVAEKVLKGNLMELEAVELLPCSE